MKGEGARRGLSQVADETITVAGAVDYDVIVRNGNEIVMSQKVTNNRLSVPGLEPGTSYMCEIRSRVSDHVTSDLSFLTQRTGLLQTWTLDRQF